MPSAPSRRSPLCSLSPARARLALAAPFALGTAQRLLARLQVFLKNTLVIERMAQVDAIVFDKTGTLTAAQASQVTFL